MAAGITSTHQRAAAADDVAADRLGCNLHQLAAALSHMSPYTVVSGVGAENGAKHNTCPDVSIPCPAPSLSRHVDELREL